MIDSGTSGIGGVMAEKGENPRGNLKRVHALPWRHPYNFDAEILFGYAGNIDFYNIVSVSIDMIAYERNQRRELLNEGEVDDVLVSCDVKIWIGRDVDRLR
ncbi:hypothetical protein DPMN_108375 [Dreissena polymorpha]|uniref:Uncharacterized protein n=1 Tax=Dreissena polymorpha TaxID=45954 RepID=A0A9D4QLZ0_DREPO|nr:hypothetical protein DPMN_108375 [Dreissena polymorpha]